MSKKGRSPDNSACEGVFGRLKNEMFYNTDWTGIIISDFIEISNNYLIWYNESRIKKSLGYMSPMEYRRSLGLVASQSKKSSAPPSHLRAPERVPLNAALTIGYSNLLILKYFKGFGQSL